MRKFSLRSGVGWRIGSTAVVVAALVGVALVADRYVCQRAIQQTTDFQRLQLERLQFRLEARLRTRANDFFILRQAAETALANGKTDGRIDPNWRALVGSVMRARGGYAKARLLDSTGREVFRLNWIGGAEAVSPLIEEVAATALQDKADRPFFSEAMRAPCDTVVFSPLDLNVENGKIEEPFRPMIRLSGKICAPDGSVSGVLVLNCDGREVLRELFYEAGNWGNPMLLNADGFWLVGPNPAWNFAFQFPEREHLKLPEQEPGRWQRITREKSGSFLEDGSFYAYRRLDPIGEPATYPVMRAPARGGEQLRWTLLTTVPAEALWRDTRQPRATIWIACAAGLVIFAPGAWMLAAAAQQPARDRALPKNAANDGADDPRRRMGNSLPRAHCELDGGGLSHP